MHQGNRRLQTDQNEGCESDFDVNGVVDVEDVLILLSAFGQSDEGDADGDGDTDISDLLSTLANYESLYVNNGSDNVDEFACVDDVGDYLAEAGTYCNAAINVWGGGCDGDMEVGGTLNLQPYSATGISAPTSWFASQATSHGAPATSSLRPTAAAPSVPLQDYRGQWRY